MTIAVLGLGAMGSRMALNLIKAGYSVTVWNRTAATITPLLEAGAKSAATPKEAVKNAKFVISMVRDDEASQSIWLDSETGALAAMEPNAIAIESSTLSPAWIKKLGHHLQQHGVSLLEAPVSGSRPQAAAGALIYIVGGSEADLEQARPLLNVMGGAIHYVGALGSAALVKLSTNALLGVQVTTIAELIGMLKRAGVDAARAFEVISATAVCSPFAAGSAYGMLAGNFTPQFTTELVAKDFGYALAAAGDDAFAPTLSAAHHVFNEAVARGLGDDNLTSVVRLFTE
jgi:3-hydroxyisobutyrate dehydrogenase